MSYGVALVAISITLVVIYKIGTTPFNAPDTCTPSPEWTCSYLALSVNGILNITVAQSSGSPITVTGIACSTALNGTGNKPAFGNIHVTSQSSYYPVSFTPNTLYSGDAQTYVLYCYSGAGISKGHVGQPFTGYVWMNYSTPYLGNQIATISAFDTKYS